MVSQDVFDKYVARAIDQIPEKYSRVHENVVFEVADVPSRQQRISAKLSPNVRLFGLFEGVRDMSRTSGISGILPAKITIFRHPMIDLYRDVDKLREQIHETVWHEVAHYFGLNHEAMHAIKNKK